MLCACATLPQTAEQKTSQRFRVTFEGNIVGHITSAVEFVNGRQHSSEIVELRTQFRGMDTIVNRVVETNEEDKNGYPLHFSKAVDIPNAHHYISGKVQGENLVVLVKRGSQEQHVLRKIPSDFLLRGGLRAKMRMLAPQGKPLTYSEWSYDDNEFVSTTLHFTATNSVPNTWRVLRQSDKQGNKMSREYYLDHNFLPLRSRVDYFGKNLEIERCPQSCVDDKLTPLRPLDQQLLVSPYQITDRALKGRIQYQLHIPTDYPPPDTGEQHVQRTTTGWIIDVCANCDSRKQAPPQDLAEYLAPTPWLETAAPQLIAAVKKLGLQADSPALKMKKLVALARLRLAQKPQFSGYATALQAYATRAGDCTEYALLLAALGRVAQVPTRVVFGLSYSNEKFHGKKHAFAPHAWVQAWVDGAWVSYDAGLEVFDAGHIALRLSHGDQRDFKAIFENFAQLKINGMQQIVKPMRKNLP